ncbi:hypothetical protein CDAR_35931 [Caerostris darwini]|uniref:Uncharacterized protein n=1 Tax=Caerostris darwini TaxID=1538125 RepID=A0AAV4R4R6_9ARAC|nr:hypothetical protein CDAR_35931 [Caerostris darwini]
MENQTFTNFTWIIAKSEDNNKSGNITFPIYSLSYFLSEILADKSLAKPFHSDGGTQKNRSQYLRDIVQSQHPVSLLFSIVYMRCFICSPKINEDHDETISVSVAAPDNISEIRNCANTVRR